MLTNWLKTHIDFRFILTPLAAINVRSANPILGIESHAIGYTFVYVFGIRVAVIQRTNPWK